MRTVVIIPAYNDAPTLAGVVLSALPHVDAVLVVDDGSTDNGAGTVYPLPVHVIAHARNQGKSASLVDGLAWALERDFDWVVTMDADGQHRGADIPRLLHAAEQRADAIVIGARVRSTGNAPLTRRCANRCADFWVSWAAGHRVLDSQSGQRVYPRALLQALALHGLARDGFTLESELIIEAARRGFHTISVPIDSIYPTGARTSYFRPVPHIWAIARMIARNLVADAFKLKGLWASLCHPATVIDDRLDAMADREASIPREPSAPANLARHMLPDSGAGGATPRR